MNTADIQAAVAAGFWMLGRLGMWRDKGCTVPPTAF
jgi:hypothetical protein